MRLSFVFSLLLIIGVAVTTHAGLVVGLQPDSSLTPGSTALFDVSVVNTSDSIWSFSVVGPPLSSTATDLQFNLSSSPIPLNFTDPFVGFVTPNTSNGWSILRGSLTPSYFIHAAGEVSLAPGLAHTIGGLSVDIPSGFTGTLTFDLANDIAIVGAGFVPVPGDLAPPIAGTPANSHSFTVAAVPEPNAFLLLGLIGSGVAGLNLYRHRRRQVAA